MSESPAAAGRPGAAQCPECGASLDWVGGRPEWMNSDQWDATKAGEYWLPASSCPRGAACCGRAVRDNRYWEDTP